MFLRACHWNTGWLSAPPPPHQVVSAAAGHTASSVCPGRLEKTPARDQHHQYCQTKAGAISKLIINLFPAPLVLSNKTGSHQLINHPPICQAKEHYTDGHETKARTFFFSSVAKNHLRQSVKTEQQYTTQRNSVSGTSMKQYYDHYFV